MKNMLTAITTQLQQQLNELTIYSRSETAYPNEIPSKTKTEGWKSFLT